MSTNTAPLRIEYRIGDVRDRLAEIPSGSIDLVVTSPPFIALRSYLPADHEDKHREIGSEPTPAAFLSTMLGLTREFRRVLAPHGSLCVELGDTYSGSGGAGGDYLNADGLRAGQNAFKGSASKGNGWPLAKSLSGIPTLYTWSLAYGRNLLDPADTLAPWRIRNLIVWARANPPVGALGDKFRPATSYITVACVGAKRWFDLDAVRTEPSPNTHARTAKGVESRPNTGKAADDERRGGNFSTLDVVHSTAGAPPLDWHSDIDDGPNGDRLWWLNTQPYAGSHYAAFPEDLPRRLIEAMCPREVCRTCGKARERIVAIGEREMKRIGDAAAAKPRGTDARHGPDGLRHKTRVVDSLGWTDCGHDAYRPGIVLDPFAGSGTTLAVAQGLGRSAIGIDIDARNADLARERCGMFLEVAS